MSAQEKDISKGPVQPQRHRIGLRRRVIDSAGLFSRGLAMGAADIVPGVSGGTIALISGVYERLIDALGSLSPAFLAPLFRGKVKESASRFFEMHWQVLIPLFAGVMIAVVAMSRVIPSLMEDHPGATYAFFFGLIAAAVWAPFARMKTRSATHVVVAVVAAVGAWLFVGLQPQGVDLRVVRHDAGAITVVYDAKIRSHADIEAMRDVGVSAIGAMPTRLAVVDEKGVLDELEAPFDEFEVIAFDDSDGLKEWAIESGEPLVVLEARRASVPWIFVCGVIAISAMILPGISGAFLLLFLGQYHAVLSSIHGVIDPVLAAVFGAEAAAPEMAPQSWLENATFLGVFNLGVLIGIVSFSRVVRWLLNHAHDATMAALTGLMIGALRQPAGEVVQAGAGAAENYWVVIGVSVAGGAALVTALNLLDSRLRSRRLSAS